MKKRIIFSFFLLFGFSKCMGQPWLRPLNIAFSTDGITFNTPTLFQDSSGVPSAIQWSGDTLVCVFQWFRQPVNSTTWDRVAVKFSYDSGNTWTQPEPIVVNGLPSTFQRPFDPTLTVLPDKSLRIFYSSSDGLPMGLDTSINTYSALSTDGINYTFELDARVDEATNRVIDPAVIFFNHAWHYLSPQGAPQDGAYHYVSPDGISFSKVPDIISDNQHNWTGNYMAVDSQELRFYGCGATPIWFNSSANGGVWNGYQSTNISGGDPTVVKLSSNNYLMIFVGAQVATSVSQSLSENTGLYIYPDPAYDFINIDTNEDDFFVSIYDLNGRVILTSDNKKQIDILGLPNGIYFISLITKSGKTTMQKFVKN